MDAMGRIAVQAYTEAHFESSGSLNFCCAAARFRSLIVTSIQSLTRRRADLAP